MKNFKNKGFTLVELLLVITILGILAAIAIPKLFPQSEKARVAEAINILGAVRQAEEAYFLQHGVYRGIDPDGDVNFSWQDLGMGDPNLDAKYFTYTVYIGGGKESEEEGGDQFRAVAFRRGGAGTQNPNNQFSGTITLDQRGQFTCTGVGRDRAAAYPYCPKG